jgi:PAS domain S-box-containing protein
MSEQTTSAVTEPPVRDAHALLRIMVVEDGVIMSRDIQQRLLAMGYAIAGVAYNGEEAIRIGQQTSPDLILMDVNLRGKIDGVGAAEEIRRHIDVPVVFVTGYSDPTTLARIRSTNPFGFVLKPFDERELRTAVEMALFRHAMHQNLRKSEERFRLISDVTSDFAYCLAVAPDGSLKSEWVTDAFTRITGIPQEEFDNFRKHIHHDDVPLVERRIIALVAGRPQVTEYRVRGADNSERWLLDHGKPIVDPATKSTVRIVGAVQDITEKKKAEQRAQSAHLRSVVVPRETLRHVLAILHRVEGAFDLLLAGVHGKATISVEEKDLRRIRKMVQIHQALYQDHARTHLPLGALLRLVIQEELRERRAARVTFDVAADHDTVGIDQALNCALIAQELMTCALSRASRDGQKRELHIAVQSNEPNVTSFSFTEAGHGSIADVDLKNPKTLSLRYIDMLVEQLEGSLEVSGKNGTTTTVCFPSTRRTS